jgi:RNA recognition motif-containing protein
MDFPLLTMNGGGSLSDERAQKKMKKKRKREEREAALLRDVIAASESLLDTPSPQKSLSSQDSSEPSKSIHSKCIAADPRSISPVLDPRVPLKLYISNLAPRVHKCHIEAWCLGQQEEEEDGETRGGGHRDEGGGGDGGSSTLSSCLKVHDMVEVVLVAEDRTNPTGRHKGFGFVELANHEAAAAVLALDGSELMGQAVSVRPAREKGGKGKGGKGMW